MRLLLEMRPALEGHAGIPQENRLLFRALCTIDDYDVQGLLQSGSRVLAPGLTVERGEMLSSLPTDDAIDRLSRVVISLQPPSTNERLARKWGTLLSILSPLVAVYKGLFGHMLAIDGFDPQHFKDFVWRSLFAKTLPPSDMALVTARMLRVLRMPYGAMHAAGLVTARIGRSCYPILDTAGVDVMIAQTPYPGSLRTPTRLIVRYMDAVPMFQPHTISRRSFHQASHYAALRRNVNEGAWFACASEASRKDLLAIFPQAEPRAVVIHCMLAHQNLLDVEEPERVGEVLSKHRQTISGVSLSPADDIPLAPEYLLMVSTLEPRKNHEMLIRAWERLRRGAWPNLKIVIVGSLGWDYEGIIRELSPWLRSGDAFLLGNVPARELRVLYRYARLTICPSVAEGFDYSGVEAMSCGGVVAASDIAVHREVFADAAEYFDPYDENAAAKKLSALLLSSAEHHRTVLVEAGRRVAERYEPKVLLPLWQELIRRVKEDDQ
ncbi:glycosyltransferase family 1 protein [Limnohabitans sp. MMS-10A-178]|uniref:glycosyltransferase family 4 protein n=1 Tax=Limnohabitans sp. MMS-10A-178 TaxID=1835767 RepID=UPI001304FCBE|nr:glycosyltransferase family 1 protein [Limnohabitans sp. MMS-10A-178]